MGRKNMIFDLSQICIVVFILAVLGYIAKYYSDMAYLGRVSYLPKRTGELDRVLYYSTSGLLIVLFLSWSIIVLYKEGITGDLFKPLSSTITLLQTNQLISEDELKSLLKLFAIFISFIFYGFLLISVLIFVSMAWGLFLKYFCVIGFVISLKDNTKIDGRYIYEMNDFLYYTDVNAKWRAIRKENIERIEDKAQSALFLIKIRSLSKKDLLLIAKSFGYSFVITFFYYTAIVRIDSFSIILFIIGLTLIVIERYFRQDNSV